MVACILAAFMPVILPVSFLLATLVAFGRLSADSEVVAFKAIGLSLYKLYVPVAIFSLIVSATVSYFTFSFIPWGEREMRRILFKMASTKAVSTLKEGTFTEGFFDLLVYADRIDSKTNKMTGVFIYDSRDPKSPMTITAQSGTLIPVKLQTEMGSAAILRLNDGNIHRSDVPRNYYEKIDFNEYRLTLKVEEGSSGDVTHAKTLNGSDLVQYMNKNRDNYLRYQEYATEYWKRFAISIMPLLFGVMGVGLGVVRMRSVKSNAVLVAFSTILLYWGLYVVGQSASEKAVLPPFWAMQLPNITVLPVAVWSFRRSLW